MKMKNVKLAEPLMIDTNSGFNNTVQQQLNSRLLNLQQLGYIIDAISQPFVDGRWVYYTIIYIVPEMNLDTEDED